jgi:hypothetical protein
MAGRGAAAMWGALAVLASVSLASGAPACKVYNNTLSDGTLGFCAGIVTYPYYVSNSTRTQVELEVAASLLAFDEKRSVLAPLLGDRCTAQVKATACLEIFPNCATVDPYFVNTCQPCGATGTCAAGGSCAPKPGVAYGTASDAWSAKACGDAGFFFDDKQNRCVAALPQYPCKDTCLLASSVDNSQTTLLGFGRGIFTNAACPLLAGPFVPHLQALAGGADPDLAAQAKGNLGPGGLGRTDSPGLTTTSLLQLAGAAIDCMGTASVALSSQSSVSFSKHPKSTQTALLAVLTANAGVPIALSGALSDSCGATSCLEMKLAAQCLPASARGASTVQPSFDFADPNSVCAPVLQSEANQDYTLVEALRAEHVLAQLQSAAVDTSAAAARCATSKAASLVYFLPSAGGMFPAPPRLDSASGREFALPSPFLDQCLVIPPGPGFGNLQGSEPLCTSKVTSRSGFNARDCLALKVDDLNRRFPRFAPERCRAAFLEMMCGQTMMKLQHQTVCILGPPFNCTENPLEDRERMALSFALPRFPAQVTCQKFKSECGSLIAQSAALSALRCDAEAGDFVPQKGCDNPALGKLVPTLCGRAALGALANLEQFPAQTQQFFSRFELGQVLSSSLASALVGSMRSNVTEPTISAVLYKDRAAVTVPELQRLQAAVCLCPPPLLAPDDVLKSNTTIPNSCCQLPCEQTMLSKAQLSWLGVFSLVLNTIGILCALFMVLTWGGFASKRKQYITFWFSFCSLMVSLSLWLLTVAGRGDLGKAVCKDNTTPHSIAEDGLSVCAWQAIWLAFFCLAECAWWFIQALDLFRKIVMKTRESDISPRKYHLLAWSLPAAAAFVLLVTEQAGFAGPTPFCLFSMSAPSTLQYGIFFIPVMLFLVLGVLLMARVLFTIRWHSDGMDVPLDNSSSNRKWAKHMALYRTPIAFVFMFVAVWVIIFAYRLTGTVDENLFIEQGQAWVVCLLTNFAAGIDDPAADPRANLTSLVGAAAGQRGCGTTQPGGISFPTTLAMFIAASSQSIAVFLIFGLKKENWSLWRQSFGLEARKVTVQSSVSALSKGSRLPQSAQGRVDRDSDGSSMTSSQPPSPYAGGRRYGGAASFGGSVMNKGWLKGGA